MFQPTLSLLGNSSTIWNSQFLRKILKIPEDQQKILDNIPGWSSSEVILDNPVLPSTSADSNKDCQQISKLKKSNAATTTSEETPNNSEITSLVTETRDTDIIPNNIIKTKSSSLDSFSLQQTDPSLKKLKRSSSFSNIETTTTSFANILQKQSICPGKDSAISKPSLSHIKEVEEMESNVQMFSNSAVQCKMSQDSLFLSELNGQMSLPSKFSNKEPSKQLYPVDEGINGRFSEDKNSYIIPGTPSKNVTKEKSKVDVVVEEESFISQPVPCAQPPSENLLHQEELVVSQTVTGAQDSDKLSTEKEFVAASVENHVVPVSNVTQSSIERNSLHITGKRKRKSKHEKTKKSKVVNVEEIKIQFSPDQLKNMMKLIKALHEL